MTLPPAGPLVATVGPPVALPGHPTGALPGFGALAGVSPLLVAAAVALLTAVVVAVGAFPGGTIECPECAAGNERGYHCCRECGAELPDSVYDGAVGGGTGDAGFE